MTVLVTGGAGFIGSHTVDALLAAGHDVRVLDDLSSGYAEHLNPAAEALIGGITDEDLVRRAVEGCELVFHFAAHRAVLRSVEQPLETDTANTHGTLVVLKAAADAGVSRVVSASSSSVYGGAAVLPTPETAPCLPRSPYAVTKLAGEHYCRVFAEVYGLETVALRYFNVYGPRQRPDSAYAAVVPLFIEALRKGEPAIVHGDGLQSRAFTYVDDVVQANLAAAAAPAAVCNGRAYNIAGDSTHSVLDLLENLAEIFGVEPACTHTDSRAGDVRRSEADVTAAHRDLAWRASTPFEAGLRSTLE
ncbi:MAG TPA: NAD-dependent epimerase/dehydratase family protein [Acidimicrobiales bacterium]|nr:NAD-dependent epimerase/dehydratase family protein [Acidimicrobiales bacterium]